MINWLYLLSLDLSLLITLILILRPLVRRLIGANGAYALWAIPLLRVILPERISRPSNPIDQNLDGIPVSGILNSPDSTIDTLYLPADIPILEIWLIGLLLCLVAQTYLQSKFNKSIALGAQPYEPENRKLEELIRESDLRTHQVRVSEQAKAPLITGLVPPRIYLPESFATDFDDEEKYWALKHEIAHYKRLDLWFQFLGECFRAVFWFNPIIHLAIRCFKEDQEMACDQSVLADCSLEEKAAYGKALMRSSSAHLVPSVLTFFTKSKERYLMLRNHKNSKIQTLATLIMCSLLAAFALTAAPGSVAQTDNRPAFEDVYDADLPKRFTGRILRVDYGEHYMLLHVDAEQQDGTVTRWVVEGGSYKDLHDAGLDSNALYPGRYVTITGYQSKDQSCDPACKLNGRDIKFEN